jgi:hypothetical protein
MKKYLAVLIVLLIGCQNKSIDKTENNQLAKNEEIKSKDLTKVDYNQKQFLDSLYTRESDNYFSKIEEIPNRKDYAYRITIRAKNGSWKKTKIIDTRPQMSRISNCNDYYTSVSFPCGGPCHSEVFVFTDKTRPDEQYDYTEVVKNHPTLITHFENEDFENIIICNLANGKELKVDVSKNDFFGFNFIDSIVLNKSILKIHYTSNNDEQKIKTTDIKSIL